ncbi:hypothetical protein V7266_19115 [Neobacillus drentensis]|uniref:hypothetical protein n=1 Tax=Neobacillus drentensis TaxID=220684 RepID=UPI002FFE061F
MEHQVYEMIYKCKTTNALVRVKNKPNITLVAKAIIMLQENLLINEQLKRKNRSGENKE